MKILFITNIPAPYRMKFFEGLGQHVDLTVLYEAKKAKNIKFNYEDVSVSTYKEMYLSTGYIKENLPNPKIITHLIKNKYDLIFLTNYRYATEMLAYVLVKFLKTPYCIEIDGGRIKIETKLAYYFKKWLLNGAEAYFSPAKSADGLFVHYGVEESKLIRYSFTSISRDYIITTCNLRKKLEKRKDEPLTFLYVGRIIPQKGVDILIKSYNEFSNNSKFETKLIIVGNSPNKNFLDYLNAIKNESTELINFVSTNDLVNIYDAADIFIFPSLYDPWGLVINEAMARGLVIFSSDKVVSSIELIEEGKNGYLFNVQNGSLKDSFESLLDHREKFDLISSENISKIRKYTIEEMVKQHNDFINQKFQRNDYFL